MGFAMRMDFVDVVVDDSLKNVKVNGKNIGYQFDICLSYYHGHFLSVIDEFGVKVDGKEVPAETINLINAIQNSGRLLNRQQSKYFVQGD